MTDELDRAVIEAAEAWAQECDESRISPTPRLRPLYDAVKSRPRALRPSRVEVIRAAMDSGYEAGMGDAGVAAHIEQAITEWEQAPHGPATHVRSD